MTPEKPYIVKKSKNMVGFIGMGIENMVMGDIIMMEDGNQLQKKLLISLD